MEKGFLNMLKIRKGLKEGKEIEALKAENASLKAQLDYVSMMTEVEIPIDGSEVNE